MKPFNNGEIELTAFYTKMGDDGIAYTRVKQGAEITITEALENTQLVSSFYIDKEFPLLVDCRGIKSMSKEARDHFAVKDRSSAVNAFALVVSSPLSSIIGSFFMGLSNPRIPAKLFHKEEDAIKWLKKYL